VKLTFLNRIAKSINRDSFLKSLIVVGCVCVVTILVTYLIFQVNESSRVSGLLNGFVQFICILMIFITLSGAGAFMLSHWIEKPLNAFMSEIYEIGRGNFSARISQPKHPLLKRLAKLINYMASEMDRLRKVNVHSIISEKNKTEAILRNIADGVIVTDMQMRILVMNHVTEKWFGLSEKEALAKPLTAFFRNSKLVEAFEKSLDSHDYIVIEFVHQILDAATPHVLQAHTSRVEDESGHPIGAIAVLRDVTKEREADRVKTELVTMVAHELKSPLTSIFGFSELLTQMDPSNEQFREYARVIMDESDRLTNFVNKFLDLSRLESGRTEVNKTPFNLGQLIARVLENLKGISEKKNIRIITDLPASMNLAMGDQNLIEQVLINLFSNAVKYSPERSKIGIELRQEGTNFLVNIIDNGNGIPPEALPHIFDKFYRVQSEDEDEEIEGSGLGLALVKEIIERHGCTIRAQSKVGTGSIFSFTVPQLDATQA
jgi:PAS domain S-box-containing protein